MVDKDTGEILDTIVKEHKYMTKEKKGFFLCYSALIGVFMEMSQAEIRIFGYCLRYAEGIHFDISKKIRLDISKETGLNERTVLNTLPALLEKKLLYKHESGLYQVNPRYVFEGSSADRNRELKVIIELGCKDC